MAKLKWQEAVEAMSSDEQKKLYSKAGRLRSDTVEVVNLAGRARKIDRARVRAFIKSIL